MKQNWRNLITLILVAICVFSVGKLLRQRQDEKNMAAVYENAALLAQAAEILPTEAPVTEATEPPAPTETQPPEIQWIPAPLEEADENMDHLSSIDLTALRQTNPDVVGWIYIPNSQVNYPLMQGEDNDFYLERTWEGTPNAYGSIFLESRNSPDFTDFNTIIYGHNMRNGSMFGGLSNYAAQWFWEWNRYIYIVTDEGIFRYEIFASYFAPIDSPTYGLSFHQLKTRENFIAYALESSQIHTGITPAVTDRIITLSTCTGMGYESRRVVQAYLKMIPAE